MARIDFHDPEGFVEEHRLNLMPPDVQDSSVEAAFLSNVLAGLGNRAARGFRHVLGAKALNHYGSEFPGNIRGSLVRPMLADARSFGAKCRNSPLRLAIAVRSTLTAAGNALGLADTTVEQCDHLGQPVSRSIGKHQRNGNAPVYADCAANVLGITIDLAADGNLPAQSGLAHGSLGHFAFDIAGHAKLDPADLGQANTAPAMVHALNGYLATIKSEGVIAPLLFWLWESAKAFESATVGIVQSFQGVLLGGLTAFADKVHLSPECRQFPCLRHIVEIVAGRCLIVSPMIAALLKSKVPHQTANASDLSKLFSLLWRWAQRKGEASKNHIKLYCTINPTTQERRAFLHGLNAGVSSASTHE